MSFYIIKQDASIDGSASVTELPKNLDPEKLLHGKNISEPGDDLMLDLSPDSGDYRGHLIEGIVTLFHEQLKETLDNLGVENIQYFPVRLRDPSDNSTESGYFLVNIVSLLDCVDMERSQIKPWVSGIGFDFISMVIDERKTNGAKVFRLADDPTKIIINEHIKNHFDKTDMLVGVEIIQTENYSDW